MYMYTRRGNKYARDNNAEGLGGISRSNLMAFYFVRCTFYDSVPPLLTNANWREKIAGTFQRQVPSFHLNYLPSKIKSHNYDDCYAYTYIHIYIIYSLYTYIIHEVDFKR